MSRTFFVAHDFSTLVGWSHLSFCQRERASRPASFFMGSLYPGLNLTSRTFFELVDFFSTLGTLDLMRKSKGRTARSHSPPFMSPLQPGQTGLSRKKFIQFLFSFGMDFSRIRMYPNYFLIFLLTFPIRHDKIDHLPACTGRKLSGKSS